MSSFTIKARSNKHGSLHTVWCMDDYFGKHKYGYIIDDGDALTEKAFYKYYTPEEQKTDSKGGS